MMSAPRVDFYILHTQNQKSIWQFCCRLAEKAWKCGNSIHVLTNNDEETTRLDDMMWTYSDRSFLPHAKQDENFSAPIIIGHLSDLNPCDLLINLAKSTPVQLKELTRIAEILNDDDSIKNSGRIRYSEYKKSGCKLQHHDIQGS